MFENIDVEELLRRLKIMAQKYPPAQLKPPFVCEHCFERPANTTIGTTIDRGIVVESYEFRGCAICFKKYRKKQQKIMN